MQFYQQASVVEKNVRVEDYYLSQARYDRRLHRGDDRRGLHRRRLLDEPARARGADRLRGRRRPSPRPDGGAYARCLFAFGLLNASVFAASILPLSTSYTICEGLGWESGVDKNFDEARQFYVLYTALIVIGAGVDALPGISLLGIMYVSQVVNGLLLPIVLIFMLVLVNDKSIMGDHTNSLFGNVVTIALSVALAGLAITSAVVVLLGK